jgi:hypothetical protein
MSLFAFSFTLCFNFLHRFVSKHSPYNENSTSPSSAVQSSQVGGECGSNVIPGNSNKKHGLHAPGTTTSLPPGIAGLSDAQYTRLEEQDVASPALENIISALHDNIVGNCPRLLPLHKKLVMEIHHERNRFLEQKSEILHWLCNNSQSERGARSNKKIGEEKRVLSNGGTFSASVMSSRGGSGTRNSNIRNISPPKIVTAVRNTGYVSSNDKASVAAVSGILGRNVGMKKNQLKGHFSNMHSSSVVVAPRSRSPQNKGEFNPQATPSPLTLTPSIKQTHSSVSNYSKTFGGHGLTFSF